MRAVLAADAPGRPAGHVVAWGQGMLAVSLTRPHRGRPQTAGPRLTSARRLDPSTGRLTGFGDLAITGPWLDVWRAPIENDHGHGGRNDLARSWRAVGHGPFPPPHRRRQPDDGARVVRVRCGPATQTLGPAHRVPLDPGDDRSVHLRVTVEPAASGRDTPIGNHTVTLPRLGLRFGLPAAVETAEWFGPGPHESYVDVKPRPGSAATRAGRRAADPVPRPQENGNHVETRWLRLYGDGRAQLASPATPHFAFTVRRWTTEDLDTRRHPRTSARRTPCG